MSSRRKTKKEAFFAEAKYLRISPTKVRRVANLVRGKEVKYSIALLNAVPHKGARFLEKVIKSAIANSQNNHKETKSLFISRLMVNEGPRSRRFQARARGRAFEIMKKTCHIQVVLDVEKGGR